MLEGISSRREIYADEPGVPEKSGNMTDSWQTRYVDGTGQSIPFLKRDTTEYFINLERVNT
jgi:hypothetical protein